MSILTSGLEVISGGASHGINIDDLGDNSQGQIAV